MNIRLPLSGLLAVTAGLYLLAVALVACSWWLAQRTAWYVYAPVMAVFPFVGPVVKSVRTARRELAAGQGRPARGCGEHCLYCCPCAPCTRDRERLVK